MTIPNFTDQFLDFGTVTADHVPMEVVLPVALRGTAKIHPQTTPPCVSVVIIRFSSLLKLDIHQHWVYGYMMRVRKSGGKVWE